ncbi:site-specific tyrosine recombinase XerC [Rubripirellula obstinata]|uniref:Site-specific tyrosine recombinase XerC n=1 Tax=Rubripirellula obstinata TaxID=406547 RepID=A0A5B1CPK2_9BACT|nr:site-specific integrase [Rubripirellula obstinata]KAA1262292.1 site-specific tyrosine recombinase XerC [Rubripirellula obstinata]
MSVKNPKYRKKKRKSGPYAVVEIAGKEYYLGKYNSKASREKYGRLVGEWMMTGRVALPFSTPETPLVMNQVFLAFIRHAKTHYRKEGEQTSEYESMRRIIKDARTRYGSATVSDFGPLAFRSVRQIWIDRGLTRQGINKNAGRLKHILNWAVSMELFPVDRAEAIARVSQLQEYRVDGVEESDEVTLVSLEVVHATIPNMTRTLADMVRVQLLSSCRPGEVCKLTPGAIDRSGDVWEYEVEHHKMRGKKGRERSKKIVYFGPEAQTILLPYLDRPDSEPLFSPAEHTAQLREARTKNRATPASCGNRVGTNRQRKPKKRPGKRWGSKAYGKAVKNVACRTFEMPEGLSDDERKKFAYDHHWTPNRLRHTQATVIRQKFGPEAAQVILGHKSIKTTETYAERDAEKAREVARRVG